VRQLRGLNAVFLILHKPGLNNTTSNLYLVCRSIEGLIDACNLFLQYLSKWAKLLTSCQSPVVVKKKLLKKKNRNKTTQSSNPSLFTEARYPAVILMYRHRERLFFKVTHYSFH